MFNEKSWDKSRKTRMLAMEYAALILCIGILLLGGISWFQFIVFRTGQPAPVIPLLGAGLVYFLGFVLLRTSRVYFKDEVGKSRNRLVDIIVGISLVMLFCGIFILIEFIENNYLK